MASDSALAFTIAFDLLVMLISLYCLWGALRNIPFRPASSPLVDGLCDLLQHPDDWSTDPEDEDGDVLIHTPSGFRLQYDEMKSWTPLLFDPVCVQFTGQDAARIKAAVRSMLGKKAVRAAEKKRFDEQMKCLRPIPEVDRKALQHLLVKE